MPNWWLWILGISIAFSFVYWAALHVYGDNQHPGDALTAEMQEAADLAARKSGQLSSPILWKMSRDGAVVAAGRETYLSSCAQCHLPDLAGAIGPNLKDNVWIHGSDPMIIMRVITDGVLEKGMPTWGPMLGRQKIAEVAAFILSHHKEPEASATQTPNP